jgi:hypothetical protein
MRATGILILLLCLGVSLAFPKTRLLDALISINKVRTQPKTFASLIEKDYKQQAIGTTKCTIPAWKQKYTESCPEVFDQAILDLKNTKPVPRLRISLCLTYFAWRLAQKKGGGVPTPSKVKHLNTLDVEDFKTLEGTVKKSASPLKKANHLVADLIIDDGNESRQHRKMILDPKYSTIGFGVYRRKGKDTFITAFAGRFSCEEEKIGCKIREKIGWTRFLIDAGLPDDCIEKLNAKDAWPEEKDIVYSKEDSVGLLTLEESSAALKKPPTKEKVVSKTDADAFEDGNK